MKQTFVFCRLVLDLILKFCFVRSFEMQAECWSSPAVFRRSPRWRVLLLLYVDRWSFHILICWEQFSGKCFLTTSWTTRKLVKQNVLSNYLFEYLAVQEYLSDKVLFFNDHHHPFSLSQNVLTPKFLLNACFTKSHQFH
jgi:hypothetical protein